MSFSIKSFFSLSSSTNRNRLFIGEIITITDILPNVSFLQPKVQWLKNQMIIGDDPKYRQTCVQGICSLEIRRPGNFDGGVYSCKAMNDHGEATVSCKLEVKRECKAKNLLTLLMAVKFVPTLELTLTHCLPGLNRAIGGRSREEIGQPPHSHRSETDLIWVYSSY